MRSLESLLDPKAYTLLYLAGKKIVQRLPLAICMAASISVLTYSLIFHEAFLSGQALSILLFVAGMLTLTSSFALEFDTKDELEALIYQGASPSDIFKLGILRVLIVSLIGYFIGAVTALIIPISQIQNVKVFYSFLVSLLFGLVPPAYSSMKSLRISLLGRSAFRPLSELEIPCLVRPSEADELKSFLDEFMKDRTELVIVGTSIEKNDSNEFLIACRYLGSSGKESSVFLATAGINISKAFQEDDTLPLIKARLILREGRCPLIHCWEVKKGRDVPNTFLANNLGTLVRQGVIEYSVYKGGRRGEKIR